MPSCLIEARKRRPASNAPNSLPDSEQVARFGFTVTKKLGNAVKRNRIRRRLKAAIAELAPSAAKSGYDYVVVARSAAFDRPFAGIRADLIRAFTILNRDSGPKAPKDPKNQTKKPLA